MSGQFQFPAALTSEPIELGTWGVPKWVWLSSHCTEWPAPSPSAPQTQLNMGERRDVSLMTQFVVSENGVAICHIVGVAGSKFRPIRYFRSTKFRITFAYPVWISVFTVLPICFTRTLNELLQWSHAVSGKPSLAIWKVRTPRWP